MRRFARLLGTVLLLGAAACGARAPQPTAPVPPPADAVAAPPGPGAAQAPAATAAPGEPAPAAAQEPVQEIDLEAIRIEVVGRDAGGEPELEAFDARSLLDDGNAAMAEERYDDAIARYEKLIANFPDSRLISAAIYNIGLAFESKGDFDAAIERYRRLASNPAYARESIDAHLRMGGVLAELGRWAEAQAVLQEARARPDLTHSDTIEAMARLGYVLLEQKNYAGAEAMLREAIGYYGKLTTGLESNYFIAMAHYYLAAIAHRQFQAIPLRLPNEQMARDLDTKAKLVLLAYDRYREVLKIRQPYWATAAGYQMSQIYKELWDDIVLAPIPPELTPEARTYYVEEVHQRVREFLEKAMNGHGKNVELAEAYKTSTVWSDASRVRAEEIAKILARETSGELVTPERQADEALLDKAKEGEYIPGPVEL